MRSSRDGARRTVVAALRAEVAAYIEGQADQLDTPAEPRRNGGAADPTP